VTPTRPGDKILTIEVLANLMVKNSSIPYQIRTIQTDIQISVAAFERLRNILVDTKGILLGVSALASFAGLYTAFAPYRREALRMLRARRKRGHDSTQVKDA
jgi:hypothetical protein